MNELKKFEKEKKSCVSLGKWKEAGEYCNCIGVALFELGNYDEALRSHQEELEFYNMAGDQLGMAIANRKIGECYAAMNNFKKSLHHVNLFLEISQSLNSPQEEQRAWATLGRTYYMKYKYESDQNISSNVEECRRMSENASLKALELLDDIKTDLSTAEYAQAKSRLLLNIGLLCEDHDLKKCAENVRFAIFWASKYELYEDLNRCQYTLADVYRKHKQYSHSLRLLDGALETAERLHNKTLLCDSLSLKASILLVLNDFEGAKLCFKRAYKTHSPNSEEHQKIAKNLKISIVLCEEHKKLQNLNTDQNYERRQIFEKIADALSSLECYELAVHFYQKTLECLEEDDCQISDKAPIYFSIAETYFDLDDVNKAIEYLKLELNCHENKPHEQVKTLWKMAEFSECKKKVNELEEIYQKACTVAEEAQNNKLLVSALHKLLYFYESKSLFDKAKVIKTKLEDKQFQDISSEDESELCEENEDPFESINLSDLSCSSDEERNSKMSRRRQRQTRKFISKRNDKGETPLHRACINGNFNYVKMLVESGQHINIRDHAGWTPLHEACNHGYYDIVEYLLNKGANINDRGGEECSGMTPLHDAATNGHLDIVQLLVSRGASVTMLTDDGKSPLQVLLEWKHLEKHCLDEQTLKLCKVVEDQLKTKMAQAGQDLNSVQENINCGDTETADSGPFISDNFPLDIESSSKTDKRTRSPSLSSDNNSSDEEEISDAPFTNSPHCDWDPTSDATTEYQNVMSNLRRSAKTVASKENSVKKPFPVPALIDEDKVVEDWLIKDTGNKQRIKKKRRKISHLTVRTSKCISNFLVTKDKLENNDIIMTDDESKNIIIDENSNDEIPKNESYNTEKTINIRSENLNPRVNVSNHSQLSFCLRVQIGEKLILVPIPEETCTVGWLSEEASQRYQDLIGNRPILRLAKHGALLHNSDMVKTFFVNNEEVQSFIEGWEELSLEESYIRQCDKRKLAPLSEIKRKLAHCNKELNLSHFIIHPVQFSLIFSALSKYKNLQSLDINGTAMTDGGFDHILSCFPAFESLISLNMNNCCLTFVSVKKMSDYLSRTTLESQKLPKLKTLILSNNLLFSKSGSDFSVILKLLPLIVIDLSSCSLDCQFFENSELCRVLKFCKDLEDFNITGNRLGNQGILNFLTHLPKKNLKKLDLSYTVNQSDSLGLHLNTFFSEDVYLLKEIRLAGCYLINSDLNILSKKLFIYCPQLQCCDISSNPALSADSICDFIKTAFANKQASVIMFLTGTCVWNSENILMLKEALKLKTMKHIYIDNIPKCMQGYLFDTWSEMWGDKSMCLTLSSMFCELSVS